MGFIWIGASKACKNKIATFRAEVKITFYELFIVNHRFKGLRVQQFVKGTKIWTGERKYSDSI